MPMGMADIATVLFKEFLKYDPGDPKWLDRDRFVLSNGHGSMLLYSILYLSGYKRISLKDIKNFRQIGFSTAGHPEYSIEKGIETTTGPLSQGLANGVGMAIAEQILNNRLGNNFFNHHTYVFAGDGCLMEGLSHEACSLAGHLKLSKLIVFFDDNSISIDGPTNLTVSENHKKRFESYGWKVIKINGHSFKEIRRAINTAKTSNSPTLIMCKTKIGYGSPNKEGLSASHGSPLGEEEVNLTRKKLNWNNPPFFIPKKLKKEWEKFYIRNLSEKERWDNLYIKMKKTNKFKEFFDIKISKKLQNEINKLKSYHFNNKTNCATRKASEYSLEIILNHKKNLIGGSADLTGSNNTKTKELKPIKKNDFSGRYIYYGVREHAMAAIMNGLSLHSGIKPYGGTFLVFSDYCRPSIRLASLMRLPVIYVMTHDSIGLGEDGPTHQPIEHLSALRAIPNLKIIRPCDIIETIEAWEYAVENNDSPVMLVLTRQNLPLLNKKRENNLVKKGAYTIIDKKNYDSTIIATGSEVEIAIKSSNALSKLKKNIRVVSMPSFELFDKQSTSYKKKILGNKKIFGIEAGVVNGWEKYLNEKNFLGMKTFGESGPYKKLYTHFGLTENKMTKLVHKMLKEK